MRYLLKALLAIAMLGSVSGAGFAQDANETAIKARQGFMQVYSFNLGKLGAMAKGEADYDAELAAALANNLLAASKMDNRAMWPQGSDNSAFPKKTRALPAMWSTFPEVMEKQAALTTAAEKMAAEAGNGLDAVKANLGGVGNGCKGCHEDFRQPQN